MQDAGTKLAQALDGFAELPKTDAREYVVTAFLRALADAESDAQEACHRYEDAEITSKGVEACASFRSPLSPLPELDFYKPRDFGSRHGIKPPAVCGHLRNVLGDKKFFWATEETLYAGANWMIFDREIAEKFDNYLFSETHKNEIYL